MLFSSITFLYYFLPITLLVYFAVPEKWKSAVLLAASLFFYFWGEPVYWILMVFSVVFGWMSGIWIEKTRSDRKLCELIMGGSIALVLLLLLIFKYTDFLMQSAGSLLHVELPLFGMLLPIGISFYTFQIISYLADVYRGEINAEHSFCDFGAYVTMFPQLIAGPIVRYTAIEKQMKGRRRFDGSRVLDGLFRFACGLAKKVLIADGIGELVLKLDGMDEKGTMLYWGIAVAYTLQIYYDFSGYSDMAIGLGKILGFDFPENFNYPYIAKSITEFWRRWHMTLGGWFRDYLYIPLGGNRVPFWRFIRNVFAVWFLSGLWHGASWNFVIWGLYFGVLLVLEKLLLKRISGKLPGLAGHFYTMLLVTVSFVIFRQEDMEQAGESLRGMFSFWRGPVLSAGAAYELKSYAVLLAAAVFGATPCIRYVMANVKRNKTGVKILELLQPAAAMLLLIVSTAFLLGSSVHPFLYFRF